MLRKLMFAGIALALLLAGPHIAAATTAVDMRPLAGI